MLCFPPNRLKLIFTKCCPHPLASSSFSFFVSLLHLHLRTNSLHASVILFLHLCSYLIRSFFCSVCLNAFTPPLHSYKCFIHQSQHSSTTPGILACSAQLPIPSPSILLRPNTWCIPRGPRTLSFFLPLALIVHGTMLLLLYIQ